MITGTAKTKWANTATTEINPQRVGNTKNDKNMLSNSEHTNMQYKNI